MQNIIILLCVSCLLAPILVETTADVEPKGMVMQYRQRLPRSLGGFIASAALNATAPKVVHKANRVKKRLP
ncbi:unnamed protein product [Nezara viridula]|uniref:Neuropeptide n=1 Tax=Nezara viridula TaxID=85310 RepID=A0A9P0HAN0_NEZVI|nr:unnamed protein product [Nezara viridula]